jgi:hypothetical protein
MLRIRNEGQNILAIPASPRVDDHRGRDASYPAPPAQIRTGPTQASGSYLGCLTAKRTLGQGCKTRG